MNSSQKYLALFAAVFLAGLLIFIAAFYHFPQKSWQEVNAYRRIPNIRVAPPEARLDIVKGSLRDFQPRRAVKILVIGDSQTFGNEAPPENVFSYLLSQRCSRYDLLNASIVDARFDDQTRLLQQVKPGEFDLIITNINPAHFSKATRVPPHHLPIPAPTSILSVLNMPDKTFYLEVYLGMDIWDEHRSIPKGYKIGVTPDYYSELDFNHKQADFMAMTDEIHRRAKHSLIFISPNLASRYSQNKIAKEWNMAAFRDLADNQCRTLSPGSRCVDLSDAIAPSGFFDIVHLNASGHEALADILQREIAQLIPGARCN